MNSVNQWLRKEKKSMIKQYCKQKLNSIKVLNCEALTDWYTIHDEFVAKNDALRKYDDMKEQINN